MSRPLVERVSDIRCKLGEGAVWRQSDRAFWWTDIESRAIWRWTPTDGRASSWSMPEMVGCMAPAEAGGWLLAMESGVFHWQEPVGGEPAPPRRLAQVDHALPDMRFNDGRCDPRGRFWASTMSRSDDAPAVGRLYRYGADGLRAPLDHPLRIGNGLAFSPDGRTMYLSDSHQSRGVIWAFDYDLDDGVPHAPREFARLGGALPGLPDGAAVDADGCYWICGNGGGRIYRFTPEGRLDRQVEVPVSTPTLCVFGGDALDTLLVTSQRPDDSAEQDLEGAVFVFRPGVKGMPTVHAAPPA